MDGAPVEKRGGSGKWIAACCGCLLLIGLLVGGGLAAVALRVKASIDAYAVEAMEFFDAAEQGDIAGAYARFSRPLMEAQSLEEFSAGVEQNPDLFAAQDVSFTSIHADAMSGVTTLKGTVTSKSGKVRHCTFGWIEEDGQKRLMQYQISDTQ